MVECSVGSDGSAAGCSAGDECAYYGEVGCSGASSLGAYLSVVVLVAVVKECDGFLG